MTAMAGVRDGNQTVRLTVRFGEKMLDGLREIKEKLKLRGRRKVKEKQWGKYENSTAAQMFSIHGLSTIQLSSFAQLLSMLRSAVSSLDFELWRPLQEGPEPCESPFRFENRGSGF